MNCIHCNTTIPEDSRFCPSCGADTSDPESGPRTLSDVTVEDRLRDVVQGHYELDKLLGRGGMASVYLAQDLKLGRKVAIKVLPPVMSHDERFVKRFHREAQTSAQLEHPNIIPIYAVESEKGVDFFVMKYIAGMTLEQVIKEGRTMERIQQILWEAARGLGYAHTQGIIHRDIKPANIMIDTSGHVVITDFGISKALESATHVTETGQIVGTPHYMSPEQAKGSKLDGRSDQYSLGVMGYRMLTGRLPFQDESLHTILYKHIFEDAPPIRDLNPEVPEYLAAALDRALAKEPEARFASMEEFATAVWPDHPLAAPAFVPPPLSVSSAADDDTPTPDTAETQPVPVAGAARGTRVPWAAVGGGGLVVVAAVVAFAVFGSGDEAPAPAAAPSPTGVDTVTVRIAAPETVFQPVQEPTPTPPPAQPTPTRQAAPPPAQPAQPAVGFLRVNAVPWGTVAVNGVDIGDTPISRHELAPGTYVITIARDGFVTDTSSVTITTGNLERITRTLTPVRQ